MGVQAKAAPEPVASEPQRKLPLESVSIVSQEVKVFALNVPPVSMMPLAKVEEAEVLLMFSKLAESPWNVELAVVDVALSQP